MTTRIWLSILLVSSLAMSANPRASAAAEIKIAPVSALSKNVREAPEEVQFAYRFALSNRDVLMKIPCYCSCETWQHASNYDCYIEKITPGGSVEFSSHGLG